MTIAKKLLQRRIRHKRVRARMRGTQACPRLVAFRSLKHNYAQLVDDEHNRVLLGVSDLTVKTTGVKTVRAKEIGREIAHRALEKNISRCVFDRNGYKYHGRVKAIAEGAREGGLLF